MKIFNHISIILLSLILALSACTDEDKTIFLPGQAEPGTLKELSASSYVLDPLKAKDVFETMVWGETTYNFDAAVTYTVQVDLEGKSFNAVEDVVSSKDLTTGVLVEDINRAVNNLIKKYGLEEESKQNVEFRVKASAGNDKTAQYTNVVSAFITPYLKVEYPSVLVVGDYSGWDGSWDKAQKVFSFKGDDIYEGWIYFNGKAQNGFKLAIPKANAEGKLNWDDNANWGLEDGQTVEAEALSIPLWSDGTSKDIKAYSKNYYKFSFNTTTGELTKLQSMDYFGIIGDGANGWGDNDDIEFEFDPEEQVFTAEVTLKDGNIKFRADHKWGYDFGQAENAETGILAQGGKDIPVTAGTYKITVDINNPEDMKFKIEGATALDPSKIIAPTLEVHEDWKQPQNKSDKISWSAVNFGDQSPSKVSYSIEMALKGTNFEGVQVLGSTDEVSFTISGDKYLEVLKSFGKDIDQAVDVDLRIVAKVSGVENPYISNTVSFNLTVMTPPTYPTELYMIGSDFGSWDWNSEGIVDMIPVNETEGAFWTIRYFEKDKGFKWSPEKDWKGDFAQLKEKEGYTIGTGDNENNAIVSESGLYMVYIDMVADKITIEPAKIYGMGDCFGSWDAGKYLFDVNEGKVSLKTTAEGELRIYAGSSATTSDWWRREFIILNGKIEYRGNGGDQERVIVAADKTITLDFNAGTGTIE